jgi:peptidoglycan/LPS O-acetylase OafA/YrhL
MNRSLSLYLDIVRPLAAFAVLLSHATFVNLSGGQIDFLAPIGVQAVDIFFVLSGFVIAYVCHTKEKDAYSYFISRATRIYSVAIPTIILVAIIDPIGFNISPETYDGPYQPLSLGLLIRSVFFLGEAWNSHRFPGSNGPYWSLGFEVWYYAVFGIILFSQSYWKWFTAALLLALLGPKVGILFPVWLIGVAVYHFYTRYTVPERLGWLLFLSSIALLALYQFLPHSTLPPFIRFSISDERLRSTAQDYLVALIFAMNIIGVSSIGHNWTEWLDRNARTIRWIAGCTFSIYLAHAPLMHFLSAIFPWPKTSPWTLVLLLTGTLILCMVFAEVTERRKHVWRTIFLQASSIRLCSYMVRRL